MLAVLLVTPGQLVSMDRLVDELWPEAPPSDARALVHSNISRLRRVLASGPTGRAAARRLVTRRPGYLLEVDEQELDARIDYLALFEEARDAFRVGDVPPEELWTLKNTGLVYLRQHRFAEAEACLRRGQALLQRGVRPGNAGGDLAGIAAVYGRTNLAEQLATTAIADANRTQDPWTAARALHTWPTSAPAKVTSTRRHAPTGRR